jgi:hypothetical protein
MRKEYDTPEAIAITDKAAAELKAHELKMLPVVGEICPVGTLAKLQKMAALVKELRSLI